MASVRPDAHRAMTSVPPDPPVRACIRLSRRVPESVRHSPPVLMAVPRRPPVPYIRSNGAHRSRRSVARVSPLVPASVRLSPLVLASVRLSLPVLACSPARSSQPAPGRSVRPSPPVLAAVAPGPPVPTSAPTAPRGSGASRPGVSPLARAVRPAQPTGPVSPSGSAHRS